MNLHLQKIFSSWYHHTQTNNKLGGASVNWNLPPWNFPAPIDTVDEYGPNGRCMALWHRSQFKGIL